jgi:hypothetical protein
MSISPARRLKEALIKSASASGRLFFRQLGLRIHPIEPRQPATGSLLIRFDAAFLKSVRIPAKSANNLDEKISRPAIREI